MSAHLFVEAAGLLQQRMQVALPSTSALCNRRKQFHLAVAFRHPSMSSLSVMSFPLNPVMTNLTDRSGLDRFVQGGADRSAELGEFLDALFVGVFGLTVEDELEVAGGNDGRKMR
jgi:hypothetical protein